jgi:hypothetical protein
VEKALAIAKAFCFACFAALACAGLLAGCADSTNAFLQTFRQAWTGGPSADDVALDPRYRYLRVTLDGRVVLLALGFIDAHPRGPVEVWYSAEREALRLQNGRLAGISGLPVEWRDVRLPDLPPWPSLAAAGKPFPWVRVRDVMPGYRYGVRDALTLSVVPAPAASALRGIDPQRLVWFEERAEPDAAGVEPLPPARYALEGETVVYGEQCIAPDKCFHWQRWPAGR